MKQEVEWGVILQKDHLFANNILQDGEPEERWSEILLVIPRSIFPNTAVAVGSDLQAGGLPLTNPCSFLQRKDTAISPLHSMVQLAQQLDVAYIGYLLQ